MSTRILVRRGNAASRPTLNVGEIGLDTDAPYHVWIGTAGGNRCISAPIGKSGLEEDVPLTGVTVTLTGIDTFTSATQYTVRAWGKDPADDSIDVEVSVRNQTASTFDLIPAMDITDCYWQLMEVTQ